MDSPAERRQRLGRLLDVEGLDALLVSNPLNVTYLTGFTGEASHLVLTRSQTLLVSDFRFTEQIAEECPGLEVVIRPPTQLIHQAVAEVLKRLGVRSVGFESSYLTVADLETLRETLPSLEWKSGRDRVEKLRAVKGPSEIAAIRQAVRQAERAFTVFRALLRSQDSEKDLVDAMEGYIRRVGGRGSSFPPIVAAGERSALPHAPPTDRSLAGIPDSQAEVLLVDWGVRGPLYNSDLTRTLIGSRISPKLETVYAVVLTAQRAAVSAVRPGVRAQDVDAVARSVITEAGYGDFFGHGLGHGFGLQIHEAPFLRPNNATVLEPGMVITIEPGVYLPGWGGVRIEDDVLVTPDGCELLSSVPKELDEMRLA